MFGNQRTWADVEADETSLDKKETTQQNLQRLGSAWRRCRTQPAESMRRQVLGYFGVRRARCAVSAAG